MLFRASAVKFREAGEEMWPDVSLGQLELIAVLDLHQIKPERMRRHPARTTNPALQHLLAHSTGRSPAPMVISTPAILRTM